MAILLHPWQNGPTELIEFALKHLHSGSDLEQRIAFLLLDVGVETLFKTYLTLPDKVTRAQGPFHDRQKAASGNFHDLVSGVEKAAGHRLQGFDLSYVQFYHDLRNKLYHQGNGITIPTDKSKAYAVLAVNLLKALLDVDLTEVLERPQFEAQQQAKRRQDEQELRRQTDRVQELVNSFERQIRRVAEHVDYRLVLPSFQKQYEDIYHGLRSSKNKVNRQRLLDLISSTIRDQDLRSWIVTDTFYSLSISVDQVTQLEIDSINWIGNYDEFCLKLTLFATGSESNWDSLYNLAKNYPSLQLSEPIDITDPITGEKVGETTKDIASVIDEGKSIASELSSACAILGTWNNT